MTAEEGARLHFHIKRRVSRRVFPFQQEIETAVPDRHFAPDQMVSLPPGDLLCCHEPSRNLVVVLRIQQNRDTIPFDADHIIGGLPPRLGRFAQIEHRMRKQKLPHAAGIWQMTGCQAAIVQPGFRQETVGPADEGTLS